MRIEEYPEQEPLSEFGRKYQEECFRLSEGVEGHEHPYGSSHPGQALTVFPAPQPNGTVIIFMHGAGWTNGYKEQMAFLAPSFWSNGISLVSVGYRLAPQYIFPASIADV